MDVYDDAKDRSDPGSKVRGDRPPAGSCCGRWWPTGLAGMLGLVAAIELVVARFDADRAAVVPLDWREARRAANREAPGCEVLCFGDSQVKKGLLPRVVQDRLGRPAYNLAVLGGQAPSSYVLLCRALAAGARPRAIVIGFFPGLLASDTRINVRQWPELLEARECLELAWASRDPRLFASVTLGLLSPSFKDRDQIRAHILAALRGEAGRTRAEILPYRRNWRINAGAQVAPRNPNFRDDAPPAASIRGVWKCKPENAAYIRRFLALADTHHLPVFWLMPTISPNWQARREQEGLDAAYTRFIRSIQAEFPRLIVIDGRRAGLDRTLFCDPAHLDSRGAVVLSTGVSDILRRYSRGVATGPRWVELPAYRGGLDDIALEDVDQSRAALKLLEARRR